MGELGPPCDLRAFTPPVSLWGLVETYVPDHERDEVRDMLGESLVEQSLELQEEIQTLLDIWRDYREETQHVVNSQTRLPEPPAHRERLKQEIRFFVESIREKANQEGMSSDLVLSRHNTEVIDYAMDTKRSSSDSAFSSRPSTARSSLDGRETPMMSANPDTFSGCSVLSDEVESMAINLNFLRFDEVTNHLRQTLEDEVAQLLRDIAFLQGCLEDEVDYRDQSSLSSREPTLTELRSERTHLEKELLSSDPLMPKTVTKPSPPFKKYSVLPGSGTSPPANHRPSPPSTPSGGGVRGGPMRANHQLASQVLPSPQGSASSSSRGRMGSAARKMPPLGSAKNPSHVVIRTGGKLAGSRPPVKVDSVGVRGKQVQGGGASPEGELTPAAHTPSPPAAPRGNRPSSASRLRKLVSDCRDTS